MAKGSNGVNTFINAVSDDQLLVINRPSLEQQKLGRIRNIFCMFHSSPVQISGIHVIKTAITMKSNFDTKSENSFGSTFFIHKNKLKSNIQDTCVKVPS